MRWRLGIFVRIGYNCNEPQSLISIHIRYLEGMCRRKLSRVSRLLVVDSTGTAYIPVNALNREIERWHHHTTS